MVADNLDQDKSISRYARCAEVGFGAGGVCWLEERIEVSAGV